MPESLNFQVEGNSFGGTHLRLRTSLKPACAWSGAQFKSVNVTEPLTRIGIFSRNSLADEINGGNLVGARGPKLQIQSALEPPNEVQASSNLKQTLITEFL